MERIFDCFEKIGIFIPDAEKSENLVLYDYIEDSLQFINFIVTIENEFEITWPDDALQIDKNLKISNIVSIIENCLSHINKWC